MSIDIKPGAVTETGNAVAQLAEDVSSAIGSDLAPNQAAIGGHRAWESSAALTQTQQAWESRLGSLAGQLGQLGNRLRSSAGSYTRADAEATRRIQEVLTLLDSR